MKKILGISLVAVLAATPLMASARDLTETEWSHAATAAGDTSNMATVSYVKGAYTELGTVIDTKADETALEAETSARELADQGLQTAINTLNGNAQTEGSVDYKIDQAISEVNSAASDLEDRVEANEGAITILNGNASTSGSVAYAVAQEASARATAVSAEATARENADTTLQGNIDAEATARTQADTAINTKIGTTALTTTDKTLTGAIEEVNQAVSTLTTNANNTYQQITDSTVATGTYAHITEGNGVGANLVSLNTAVVANDGAITTINNKQIPVVTDWANGTVTQKKISELVTAQN